MALFKNSLIASACTFLCRFTGLLREIVYSFLFGACKELDAFNVAFRIPNLLRDLFAEGALSQSYTSVTTKARENEGDEVAWEVTRKIATLLSSLMLVIVTAGIFLAGPIMDFMYSGDKATPENIEFATGLSRIMWPFIGFASLSALTMGALNILGIFGLPMLASAAFNIVSVLCGLLLGYYIDPSFGPNALYGFAVGVTLGGLAQWLVQVPRLRKEGFRWGIDFQWRNVYVSKILWLMIPAVASSGVTQFAVFINTFFALKLKEGSVVELMNAFRLWQLPVGLFGVATGMVVLPAVSRLVAGGINEGKRDVAEHVAIALRFVSLLAVPSVVILGLLGTEVVSVFFQRGKFTALAAMETGDVLAAYAIGLLGFAGTKVVQPVFLALEERWVPLIASLGSLIISLSLNYYFVCVLHKDVSWLALTTSMVTTFNFFFYFLYLRVKLGTMCGRLLLSGLVRILGAGLMLGVFCYVAHEHVLQGFTSWHIMTRIAYLGMTVGIGMILYFATSWMLRVPELELLKKRFLKK